jgi:ABC-type Mn2+/Zn2+ transport system ATPase subunit
MNPIAKAAILRNGSIPEPDQTLARRTERVSERIIGVDRAVPEIHRTMTPFRQSRRSAVRTSFRHPQPRAARERAHAALSQCGVEELASRRPAQLSGGQRQRVALARAIVGERRLIVADEPTAAVDTVTARSIVELLASLAHSGRAVLMTTHDSRLAGFADDVMFLRDGTQVRADDDRIRVSR